MLTRRLTLVATPLIALGAGVARASGSFAGFLDGVAAQARASGISNATIARALRGLQPNARVLELDGNQAEFTQTWQHYRDVRLSPQRVSLGRAAHGQSRNLLSAVATELQVDPSVIMGIWGMETNYGGFTGGFNVVEALATLAWNGRRASYFRPELLAALAILDHGDVSFARMMGSYAGAMGQPQFMPTSFKRYAMDFDGDGRRDIWDDRSDVLASIANYLAKSGWTYGEPWGVEVILPEGMAERGKPGRAPISAWTHRGVRAANGEGLPQSAGAASLVQPAGSGGQAFLAYPNFAAIRRYNPSDFYAIAVGMLGDLVVG